MNYSQLVSRILALSSGFMASRIFLTALELNLFRQLGDQKLTSVQIADQLHTDPRATEIILNALVSMDVLGKNDNVYANLEEARDTLIPGDAGLSFVHPLLLWDIWSNLTEMVKTGEPAGLQWSDIQKRELAFYMKHYATERSETLVKMINTSDIRRMLDLGGGCGLYAIAFARRNPDMEILLLDYDEEALGIAREEIAREDLQTRIHLTRKDFFQDDIGGDYDLILLASILCLFGEQQNTFLLSKAKDALKDGGSVVILDRMLDESKTKPLSSALFSVNMLTMTQNGRAYSFSEVKTWLSSLGFRDIQRFPLGNAQALRGKK
ncbi:MAG: methyltransferase [Nitrospirota bacterium]